MELNDLETKFFTHVLKMELDKPAYATLKLDGRGELYAMTVIPKLERYFEIHFYHDSSPIEESYLISRIIKGFPNPVLERAKVERTHATIQISTPEGDLEHDVRILGVLSEREGILLLKDKITIVRNSVLKYAELHLTNFKNFIGNRVVLCGDEWRIALVKHRGAGSYVGHRVRIERKNGGEFKVEELEKVLDVLRFFLTFVAGNYQFPTAVIGYDSHDQVVCGQIGGFTFTKPPANWFNRIGTNPEGVHLERIFPAFWSKWQTSPEEIAIIIDYYVSSATMERCGLLKDAVAKSYEALEFLAGLVLSSPDPDDYARNIAKALKEYEIPNHKLRNSRNPQTVQMMKDLGISGSGFQLINCVRNYITHPMEKRDPQTTKTLYREYFDTEFAPYLFVYDLSQFYLEYLFLKAICEYTPPLHRHLIEYEERRYAFPKVKRSKRGEQETIEISIG